ncbi:MAG: hypothetical protein WD795_00690 [Woeseia sp.]
MSRGLGQLQRRILAELEHVESASILTLARNVHDDATAANRESIRRALHSLIARRLVAKMPGYRSRERVYYTDGTKTWHTQFTLRRIAETEARRQYEAFCKQYGPWKGTVDEWMDLSVG